MVKKNIFFITCIALISILSVQVYAKGEILIDAQPSTRCVNGDCITRVNLEYFMDSVKITEVKSSDLSDSKPKLDVKLKEFDYNYENNTMVFWGHVDENTYWTFDLKNGYIIDPFWNVSSFGWSSNQTTDIPNPYTSAGNGGSNYGRGWEFNTYGTDIRVVKACAESGIPIVNGTVSNATHICYATSVSSQCAEFNCNVSHAVADSGNHYVMLMSSGNTWFYINNTAVSKYPIDAGYFNITEDAQGTNYTHPVQGYNTNFMQTGHITIQVYEEQNTTYEFDLDLYLNGSQSNISGISPAFVNMTGVITGNLTDNWNISLMVNGTEYNNSENLVFNSSTFTTGAYNITAFCYFNDSMENLSVSYFLTVNATPLTVDLSQTYCADNTTLFVNRTVVINGNPNTTEEYIYCDYGCNNVTMSCELNPLVETLVLILILIGAILFIFGIDRLMRGRR